MKCHKTGASYTLPPEPDKGYSKLDGWWLGYYTCPECHETRAAKASKWAPSLDTLERQDLDGVVDALDGCRVEPDGTCPHGMPSWLVAVGIM